MLLLQPPFVFLHKVSFFFLKPFQKESIKLQEIISCSIFGYRVGQYLVLSTSIVFNTSKPVKLQANFFLLNKMQYLLFEGPNKQLTQHSSFIIRITFYVQPTPKVHLLSNSIFSMYVNVIKTIMTFIIHHMLNTEFTELDPVYTQLVGISSDILQDSV